MQVGLQKNYLPQPLRHAKALRHKSFTSSENNEAKKLSESRTTFATIARHLNVVKIILYGTFDEK